MAKRLPWVLLFILVPGLVTGLNTLPVQTASPPEPTYASANVDGNSGEWDTTNDFFANMYEAADPDRHPTVISKLYLRYDCSSGVLYALVLIQTGFLVDVDGLDNHFLKYSNPSPPPPMLKLFDGNSGDDGTPDFQFIGLAGSGDNQTATGWEGSGSLAVGSYQIDVHTLFQNADGSGIQGRTSAVIDREIDLLINCPATTTTTTTSTSTTTISTSSFTTTFLTNTETTETTTTTTETERTLSSITSTSTLDTITTTTETERTVTTTTLTLSTGTTSTETTTEKTIITTITIIPSTSTTTSSIQCTVTVGPVFAPVQTTSSSTTTTLSPTSTTTTTTTEVTVTSTTTTIPHTRTTTTTTTQSTTTTTSTTATDFVTTTTLTTQVTTTTTAITEVSTTGTTTTETTSTVITVVTEVDPTTTTSALTTVTVLTTTACVSTTTETTGTTFETTLTTPTTFETTLTTRETTITTPIQQSYNPVGGEILLIDRPGLALPWLVLLLLLAGIAVHVFVRRKRS